MKRHALRRTRRVATAGLLAALAAGFVACGGGTELLLLAVVTPLNGAWRLNGDSSQEGLNINSPDIAVQLYASRYDVQASLLNPVDYCGARDDGSGQVNLAGTYDNGRLILRAQGVANAPVCIDATVVSLIRMNAVAGGARPNRYYQNNRVDVNLDSGLWVSANGSVRLKFAPFDRPGGGVPVSLDNDEINVPVKVCDSSPGVSLPVLAGTMNGFVTATGEKPVIARLVVVGGTEVRFTRIEYTDGATIALRNAANQEVVLKRQRETTPSVCR
jgi:hypothetical protein